MKPMNRIVFAMIGAVVSAALTAAFALSMTATARSQTSRLLEGYGKSVEAYVPAQSLSAGTEINEQMLRKAEWPAALLPEGAVTDPKKLIGKTVASAIYAGEPIVSDRIGEEAAAGAVSVPKGQFAVSVATKDTLAVGGAVRPGNNVRLVVTDGSGQTATVAEKVLVLATSSGNSDQEAGSGGLLGGGGGEGGGLAWVTLSLSEELVEPVIQASDVGVLHLVLLN